MTSHLLKKMDEPLTTRSGKSYGPLKPEWNEKIQLILEEIDLVQEYLPEGCLSSANQLFQESQKRMEDALWMRILKACLEDLLIELKRSGGFWIQRAQQRAKSLLMDVEGAS
jgi:hypothetical protein